MFEVIVFKGEEIDFIFQIAADDEEAAEETVSRLNRVDGNFAFALVPPETIGLG